MKLLNQHNKILNNDLIVFNGKYININDKLDVSDKILILNKHFPNNSWMNYSILPMVGKMVEGIWRQLDRGRTIKYQHLTLSNFILFHATLNEDT